MTGSGSRNESPLVAAVERAAPERRLTERLTEQLLDAQLHLYRVLVHAHRSAPERRPLPAPAIDVALHRRRLARDRARQPDSTIDKLRERVLTLARHHGIEVREVVETVFAGLSVATPTRRFIEVPRMRSAAAIAVALHEIGHVAHPCVPAHGPHPRRAPDPHRCIPCELQAWRAGWGWALAMDVFTQAHADAMFAQQRIALGTYAVGGTAAEQDAIAAATSERTWLRLRLDLSERRRHGGRGNHEQG